MSNIKLKPCPFCGSSKVQVIPIRSKMYKRVQACVECSNCNARSGAELINELRADERGYLQSVMDERTINEGKHRVIDKWNRRVTNEPICV